MAQTDPILSIIVKDQALISLLEQIERKVRNPALFWKQVGEYMLLVTDERFEKEVDPSGVPWIPNSRRTVALKTAQGRINKILQSRGIGRASIRYQVIGNRLSVGTPVTYMRKHQLGQQVPKREFLGVSEEDLKEIRRIGETFLVDQDSFV